MDAVELATAPGFEGELGAMDNDIAFDEGEGASIIEADVAADGVPTGDRFLDVFFRPGAAAAGIRAEVAEGRESLRIRWQGTRSCISIHRNLLMKY